MIRIGDSCVLHRSMITPESNVVEGRRFMDFETEWIGIADKCIKEKKFSITTVCLNYNENPKWMPTEVQWRKYIENTVKELSLRGGNKNNCRIDIINEPTKRTDIEEYIWLENIAHDQIKGRLIMGSGCDELLYDGFQQNVASRGKAEVYVIHIQASCDNKVKTTNFVNIAKNRAVTYKKILDCNEGNYKDVSTSSGFDLMKFQMQEAEKAGCANYCNVFNDLVRSVFNESTSQWDFLAFKIDGAFRNKDAERHYNEWIGLMDSKGPVPNIIEVEEDMKLEKYYYKNKVTFNRDPKKAGVRFIQTVIGVKPDADWGNITDDALEVYQIDNGLEPDRIVGPLTFREMMKTDGKAWIDLQYFVATGEW
jgi:hypothetical protein